MIARLIYRSAEAARYVGLTPAALAWHRAHGTGPAFYRLGPTTVGYSLADLDGWLAARRVAPTRPVPRRGRPPKLG